MQRSCSPQSVGVEGGGGVVFLGLKQMIQFLLASQTGCLFGAEHLKRVL